MSEPNGVSDEAPAARLRNQNKKITVGFFNFFIPSFRSSCVFCNMFVCYVLFLVSFAGACYSNTEYCWKILSTFIVDFV